MGLFAGGGDYKKHQEIHTLDPFFFNTMRLGCVCVRVGVCVRACVCVA